MKDIGLYTITSVVSLLVHYMYDSNALTTQELLKAQLYLFDKRTWEQNERMYPTIPLTPETRRLRRREVRQIIHRANKLGIIFEHPYADDIFAYV